MGNLVIQIKPPSSCNTRAMNGLIAADIDPGHNCCERCSGAGVRRCGEFGRPYRAVELNGAVSPPAAEQTVSTPQTISTTLACRRTAASREHRRQRLVQPAGELVPMPPLGGKCRGDRDSVAQAAGRHRQRRRCAGGGGVGQASVEIPAPATGVLTQIVADEGATVPVGGQLGIISPAAPATDDYYHHDHNHHDRRRGTGAARAS